MLSVHVQIIFILLNKYRVKSLYVSGLPSSYRKCQGEETGKILPVQSELCCFLDVKLKWSGEKKGKKKNTVSQTPSLFTQVKKGKIGANNKKADSIS